MDSTRQVQLLAMYYTGYFFGEMTSRRRAEVFTHLGGLNAMKSSVFQWVDELIEWMEGAHNVTAADCRGWIKGQLEILHLELDKTDDVGV
jgi:hypothetical protein